MFRIYSLIQLASHVDRNHWLRSKGTRILLLTIILFSFSGWAVSPGYTSSGSTPSHSAALGQATPQGTNVWTNIGPVEGGTASLAIDPSNPNILYTSAASFLYKSVDSGSSWKPISDRTALANRNLISFAIDPANSNILYVIAASYDDVEGFINDMALLKSTDGGANWDKVNDRLNRSSRGLVIDPRDSNTLYVMAASDGIFKSVDGGANWKQISGKGFLGACSGLALDSVNSNILYALADGGSSDFLLKSADGGVHWKQILPTEDVVQYISSLAIDPHNTNVLYVGIAKPPAVGTDPLIAKSTDGGVSWRSSEKGLPFRHYVNTLAVDPSDANTIYAGISGYGVFRSTDGGASWGEFNAGVPNLQLPWAKPVSALVIDPSGTRLYASFNDVVFAYQFNAGCTDALSPDNQAFEVVGGSGSIAVSAASDCPWDVISNAGWLNLSSEGSSGGNGTVHFSVAVNNTSTRTRISTLVIGGQSVTITQAGPSLLITAAHVVGKDLYVDGENFDTGAVILLNDEKQKTRNDDKYPEMTLIGRRVGKKIGSGQSVTLQVRNPDGALSPEFTFTNQ